MRAFRIRQRLTLGGLAAGGIMAAHWLGYRIAAPDIHERQHILQQTGHRLLAPIAALALGFLVAGLCAFIAGAARRGATPTRAHALVPTALRLLLLQAGGFLLMEALERAVFGHGLSWSLVLEAPVAAGLLVQFLVALAGAFLLIGIARVVEELCSEEALVEPDSVVTWFVTQIVGPRLAVCASGVSWRGPPHIS